jgi:hypothetical protein
MHPKMEKICAGRRRCMDVMMSMADDINGGDDGLWAWRKKMAPTIAPIGDD